MKRLNSSQSSLVLVVIHKSGSSNLTILEVIMILVAQFANVGKFWKGFYHVASFKCQSWLQTIIMKKFNNSVVNSIQFWLVHDLVSLWLDIIECWWIIVTHNLKFFHVINSSSFIKWNDWFFSILSSLGRYTNMWFLKSYNL